MPQEIHCHCAKPFLAGAVRSFFDCNTGASTIDQMCLRCHRYRRVENFPLVPSPALYNSKETDIAHTLVSMKDRRRIVLN